MKKVVLFISIFAFIILLILVAVYVLDTIKYRHVLLRDKNLQELQNKIIPAPEVTELVIGEKKYILAVADTPETRQQGLSGKEQLPENRGLLFIFEKADIYGIWMKDMKFAIDILWLDKDFKIVGLKKNALPELYPEIYNPQNPALYVLETNTGFIDEHKLSMGSTLTILGVSK